MKPTCFLLSLFFLSLPPCGPLSAGDREARTVHYSRKDIIELRCQVRVSTAIVLPTNEKVLDFTTGDKEYWIVNGAENFCYVHPAKPGISSNLNLICSSGNVYSFLLTEVSTAPNLESSGRKPGWLPVAGMEYPACRSSLGVDLASRPLPPSKMNGFSSSDRDTLSLLFCSSSMAGI